MIRAHFPGMLAGLGMAIHAERSAAPAWSAAPRAKRGGGCRHFTRDDHRACAKRIAKRRAKKGYR